MCALQPPLLSPFDMYITLHPMLGALALTLYSAQLEEPLYRFSLTAFHISL